MEVYNKVNILHSEDITLAVLDSSGIGDGHDSHLGQIQVPQAHCDE